MFLSNNQTIQEKKDALLWSDFARLNPNRSLETIVDCVGSSYNRSCLFKNLYYYNGSFTIFRIKGRTVPPCDVRYDAFMLWSITPNTRIFDSYEDLENFVRIDVRPKFLASVTLHFGQPWHHNIGHALFDGLYAAYIALTRFPPRHLLPFRALVELADCKDCWSEDVYGRFAGLGLMKLSILEKMSRKRWFMFEELIMGSGTFCQRCIQPNYQLIGGVELNASRLFRDRMYQMHGFIPQKVRRLSSEYRTPTNVLQAFFIDNKRYTDRDRKEIEDTIYEINNYTNFQLTRMANSQKELELPLVNVSYIVYNKIKAENNSFVEVDGTSIYFQTQGYELIDNDFMSQLKLLHGMDIQITGPGTGQMYQTFLPDGSININVGGLRPWGLENTNQSYASYLEQYMTAGTPYIKGLYYPINDRNKGLKKEILLKLIHDAAQIILQGFSIPVNPRDNLAANGQLFVEMCEKDKEFCSLVTERVHGKEFHCIDLWVEDFVHEYRQWSVEGFNDNGKKLTCPFNHTLLRELREKYGIKHVE